MNGNTPTRWITGRLITVTAAFALLVFAASCDSSSTTQQPKGTTTSAGGAGGSGGGGEEGGGKVGPCPNGTDFDKDGYGDGCANGPDCKDDDPSINPAALEICDNVDNNCNDMVDEGVQSECGNCSADCKGSDVGKDAPFPMPEDDTDIEADGVGLDENGDLILDKTNSNFNFAWIANTEGASGRGTLSKVDTVLVKEVARYLTVTCFGNPGYLLDVCLDVGGNEVQQANNKPSRTAVDFNFDVWVANRAFGGQPSTTKVANALEDCVDRNNNNKIDTSSDQNGDGVIEIDCDGDQKPDTLSTVCTNAKPPEFLGLDDECVLFTTNFAKTNEYGRTVCLDQGDLEGGSGNAWVGTNNRSGNNRFYKLNGSTGLIMGYVDMPSGIGPYGCVVDGDGILWTVGSHSGVTPNAGRGLTYFDTKNVTKKGPVLADNLSGGSHSYYGISLDPNGDLWLGGWETSNVYRYKPDRTNFDTLSQGTWTRVRTVEEGSVSHTAGIQADTRGWVWVASNSTGFILRVPQAIPDGDNSWAAAAALGGIHLDAALGGTMRGAGVDFAGHVWGISHDASQATRIDLDSKGDAVDLVNNVFSTPVGKNPYTYSDFTGFGLKNFTRPSGTYRMLLKGCDSKDTTWLWVKWSGKQPTGTKIGLRARSGPTPKELGSWVGQWTMSPATLSEAPGPVLPMPAKYLQIELELSTEEADKTPIVEDLEVLRDCSDSSSN